eukprot:48169-Chlamydomonas_euryale.AAC.1
MAPHVPLSTGITGERREALPAIERGQERGRCISSPTPDLTATLEKLSRKCRPLLDATCALARLTEAARPSCRALPDAAVAAAAAASAASAAASAASAADGSGRGAAARARDRRRGFPLPGLGEPAQLIGSARDTLATGSRQAGRHITAGVHCQQAGSVRRSLPPRQPPLAAAGGSHHLQAGS